VPSEITQSVRICNSRVPVAGTLFEI